MQTNFFRLPVLFVVLLAVLAGCAGQQSRTRSSVVDYLYPKTAEQTVQPSMPTLNIPIKVGIAFVPEQSRQTRGANLWTGVNAGGHELTEAKKTELLDKVAEHFRGYDFVSEIEVIPSAYLTPGGSFSNLDQIRTMYGTDVVALVSYDQVQFTDEGMLSLTYWTLVGAYAISGEKNDTSTMLDTAVYDIPSRKLLFRAPGTSHVSGSATPVNLSEQLRKDSIQSFEEAADDMIANLDVQLSRFKEKIKSGAGPVKIIEREGYSGGGALSGWELIGLFLCCVAAIARRRFGFAG